MASNTALQDRNERVKYARSIGVEKPHTLKREALEDAINDRLTTIATAKAAQDSPLEDALCEHGRLKVNFNGKMVCPCDPFDPINPEVEGDHLTPDALPEPTTVADAVALRESVREVWLMDAVEEIKGLYRQAGHPEVDKYPVLISTGFPQGNIRKIIGQCHHAETNNGTGHIFINPSQDETMRVLEIIAHELAHLPGYGGHTGDFRKMASKLLVPNGGPQRKGYTSTNISPDSLPAFEDIANRLGEYPHTKVNIVTKANKPQETRMLKAVCSEDDGPCPLFDPKARQGEGLYTIRGSKKWFELGMPKCPCGSDMVLVEKGGE